jgi:hypothetical protein
MKNLIILVTLSFMTSAFAIDGTFVEKVKAQKGQIIVAQGFEIHGSTVQLLEVVYSDEGIKSIDHAGHSFGPEEQFIKDNEYPVISETTGFATFFCKTRFGVTSVEENNLKVAEWSYVTQVSFGCPFSKKQSSRGKSSGMTEHTEQTFTEIENGILITSKYAPPRKLIRLK